MFENSILIKDFDLKRISSFKTGGKVKYYFIPGTEDELINLLKSLKKKVYIIGNFTNILASDKGYDGIVINLKGFTNYIYRDKNSIIAGASVLLSNLIKFAIENSLAGLEKLAGIPGTVGGALYMNAGAFGSQIGDFVEYVKCIDFKGNEKIFLKNQINFSYRSAKPIDKYIIIEAGFKLKKGKKEKMLKTVEEILKKREEKQPLEFPSAGSVFKRPSPNCYAGELIEKAGCKGLKVGDAMVSEKHANFIINKGKATSSDIYKLLKIVQKRVYKKFKIKLLPEIKFLGKF